MRQAWWRSPIKCHRLQKHTWLCTDMKESQRARVVPSTMVVRLSQPLPLSSYREHTVGLYRNLQPLEPLWYESSRDPFRSHAKSQSDEEVGAAANSYEGADRRASLLPNYTIRVVHTRARSSSAAFTKHNPQKNSQSKKSNKWNIET